MPSAIAFSGRRMSEILDSVEPKLRRAFLLMIARIRGNLSPDALQELIVSGRTFDAEAIYERAAAAFAREASNVFLLGGEAMGDFVAAALDVVTGFDQFSERAVAHVRDNELSLIREFVQEQRDVVRQVLQEGIARGTNPIEQAREFRDSIGLTARQESAVLNYRRLLESGSREALSRDLRDRRFDRTVTGAIASGEPLSSAQIDQMVGRYSDRYVKFRAETIARTEALHALHEGVHEALDQLVDRDDVAAKDITRTWNTAGDERVRDAHQTMAGQTVGPDEPFIDGDGNHLMYPGDPNAPLETTIQCRCVESVRIAAQKPEEAFAGLGANVTVSVS